MTPAQAAARILEVGVEAGAMDQRTIFKALNGHASAELVGAGLEILAIDGLVRSRMVKTRGRPATVWDFRRDQAQAEETPVTGVRQWCRCLRWAWIAFDPDLHQVRCLKCGRGARS